MNVFRITISIFAAICVFAIFAVPANAQDKQPAWVTNCDRYLEDSGNSGFCGVGMSGNSSDSFYNQSQARQLARQELGIKAGSLVFKAVEKSKCWADGMAPAVAIIKVSESSTERIKEWTSDDNRCYSFLKMNLRGFQKTVYRTCGLPDGKSDEIYRIAEKVWKAHFGHK